MLSPEDNTEQNGHNSEEAAPIAEPAPESPAGPSLDTKLYAHYVEPVPLIAIHVGSAQHDDQFIVQLADSIAHIGLQNPPCVRRKARPEHDTLFDAVSGRGRIKACATLGWTEIPCHVLDYEEDEFTEDKMRLAEYEENLLRKQLTHIERCTTLGHAKAAYLKIYPETGQGRASKKLPGTGRLPYAVVASEMLNQAKSTTARDLQIFSSLIEPGYLGDLVQIDHPILGRIEELSALASSRDDIQELVEILCINSDATNGKFCSWRDAKSKLSARKKEAEALRQAEEAAQIQRAKRESSTRNRDAAKAKQPEVIIPDKPTTKDDEEQGAATSQPPQHADTSRSEDGDKTPPPDVTRGGQLLAQNPITEQTPP